MSVVEAPVTDVSEPSTDVAGRSQRQIAWSRLRRDKVGMISLAVILFLIAVAIFAPLIAKVVGVDPYTFNPDDLSDSFGGLPISWAPDASWWAKGGITWAHPLGVEPSTGRDLLARLMYGARVSLVIAFTSTLLIVIIGTLVGIVSGYNKGWIDQGLGRAMDMVIAFPFLLMALALGQPLTDRFLALGFGETEARVAYLVFVFSLFSWPYLARIVRGQVLSLREREFVESAVSLGSGTSRILFKEILPNLWAPILVVASITLPGIIASEAALAFLGVGVTEPTPTWGGLLGDSVTYWKTVPTFLFFPGMVLFAVVLTFNLLGDAVRDALDPRAGRV